MSRSSHPIVVLLLPLLLVIAGCGSSRSAPAGSQAHAPGTAPRVHLPRDQAAHLEVNNEWWYVVGHVHDGKRTFGYEVTVFRLARVHLPGATAGSPPVTIYRTDVAITDEVRNRFYHQISYYFPQSATVSSTTLRTQVGRIGLRGPSPADMSLQAVMPKGTIQLHLSSRRAAMDVGGRGYIPFGSGFTYYYSLTDVATTGSLRIGGRSFRVSGISWLDHQWGNWSWSSVRGWTWMALQLDNHVQLSVFDVRGTGTRTRAASVLMAGGSLLTPRDVTQTALGMWKSPHSGATYPSGWLVHIPQLRATLRVEPTVRDQEMFIRSQPEGTYWEGSGRVQGNFQGKAVKGMSYTELTGYAGRAGGVGVGR